MELIIHTDGGSRGNPGKAAYGVVYFLNGMSELQDAGFLGTMTNNEAEYLGLLAALKKLPEFLADHPVSQVRFRLDSNLVVMQVSGKWKIKEERMRMYVAQAHRLMKEVSVPIVFEQIPREQNKEADRLVNEVLDGLAE